MTNEQFEFLFKQEKYNPTKIGIEILKMEGYEVKEYKISGAIYVYKNGKIVWCDSGANVD